MSVNTQELYDAKAIKFGTSPDSTTYSSAFLSSLRRVITRLNNKTGQSIEVPESFDEDVDCDEGHYDTISIGLDYYLEDTHLFTTQPVPVKRAEFEDALRESQRIYYETLDMNRGFGTLTDSTDDEVVV